MSTYIRIFFEEKDENIGWESLHIYDSYIEYYRNKSKSVRNIIRVSGAVHLGFLSTIFYCWYTLKQVYINGKFFLNIGNIVCIILAIVLFMILVLINKDYYRNYNMELEKIMRKYKEDRKKT